MKNPISEHQYCETHPVSYFLGPCGTPKSVGFPGVTSPSFWQKVTGC